MTHHSDQPTNEATDTATGHLPDHVRDVPAFDLTAAVEVAADAYALAEEMWQDECSISELELMQQVISSDWLKAYVAEQVERAKAEHRHEWADFFERWTGAVGPEPLTVEKVIAALRRKTVPFGCSANDEGNPK